MTPHIKSKKSEIAKKVIMPGDPLRAKVIAETYLEDYKLVNDVRNMLAYTGKYKGTEVTIFASGMGIPSMGIYSYELFKFYDVEEIIRVGTCGSFDKDIDLYETILVDNSYSTSPYNQILTNEVERILPSNKELNNKIKITAAKKRMKLHIGNIYCSEVFYQDCDIDKLKNKYNCLGTEMETFALFSNAKLLNKKASAIVIVSDNLITKKETSSDERQNSLNKMIELALDSII